MRGGRRDCERAELGVRLAEESVQPLERRRRVAAEGGHVRVEQPQREGHHRPAPPRVDGLVPLVPVRAAVQVAEHRHLARRLRHVAQLEQRDDPVPAKTQQHVDRVRAVEQLLGERAGRLPRAGVRQSAHALLRRRHVGRRRARWRDGMTKEDFDRVDGPADGGAAGGRRGGRRGTAERRGGERVVRGRELGGGEVAHGGGAQQTSSRRRRRDLRRSRVSVPRPRRSSRSRIMPPPPQVVALGAAFGVVAIGAAKNRRMAATREKAAREDAQRMEAERKRNIEANREADALRQEQLNNLSRKRKQALPTGDLDAREAREYEDVLTAEFFRLGKQLRQKQAEHATGQTFTSLPVAGRPEQPAWVELFVLLAWDPSLLRRIGYGIEVMIEHAARGATAAAERMSSFSVAIVLVWLSELSKLQPAWMELTTALTIIHSGFEEAVWCVTGSTITPMLMVLDFDPAENMGAQLLNSLGLFSRPQHTLIREDNGWMMSLNKGIALNRHYDFPGKGKYVIANFDLNHFRTSTDGTPDPSTCQRLIASEDIVRRRVEFRAYFEVRRMASVLKTRLVGASCMVGMDLEHALAISCHPAAIDVLKQLQNLQRESLDVLDRATDLSSTLSQQLDSLVPEDDSLSDHDRKAELQAFVDDWIAQQRHRTLQTAIDGRGRIPSEAVYPTPVLNVAFKGLQSLPAGPLQLKHELRLAAEARDETLARDSQPPAWWRWVMLLGLFFCAVGLLVISWSVVYAGWCNVAPAAGLGRCGLDSRGGKRNVLLATVINMAMTYSTYLGFKLKFSELYPRLSLDIYTWCARWRKWPSPVMLSVEAESGRCRRTLHKWSITLLAKEMVEHIAAGSVTRSRALSFVKELAALHAESVSLELSTTTVDKKLVPMPGSVDDANAFLLLPVTGSAAPPAQEGPTLALTLENFLHGAVQEAQEVQMGAVPEEVGVLRFPIGTRVMARCPNRGCSLYHPGVVVALYPFPRIPYRVMLDKGDTAYAEVDRDFCIYRERLALPAPAPAGAPSENVASILAAEGWKVKRSVSKVMLRDALGDDGRQRRREEEAAAAAAARQREREEEARRRNEERLQQQIAEALQSLGKAVEDGSIKEIRAQISKCKAFLPPDGPPAVGSQIALAQERIEALEAAAREEEARKAAEAEANRQRAKEAHERRLREEKEKQQAEAAARKDRAEKERAAKQRKVEEEKQAKAREERERKDAAVAEIQRATEAEDPTALDAAIKAAKEAGVPVATVREARDALKAMKKDIPRREAEAELAAFETWTRATLETKLIAAARHGVSEEVLAPARARLQRLDDEAAAQREAQAKAEREAEEARREEEARCEAEENAKREAERRTACARTERCPGTSLPSRRYLSSGVRSGVSCGAACVRRRPVQDEFRCVRLSFCSESITRPFHSSSTHAITDPPLATSSYHGAHPAEQVTEWRSKSSVSCSSQSACISPFSRPRLSRSTFTYRLS